MVRVVLALLAAMANVPAALVPVLPLHQLQLQQDSQVSEGFLLVCAWFVELIKMLWKNDVQVPQH